MQHGDFVPWNTRVQPKGLILFDWESAAWEAPALWDRFHFLAQTECHLNLRQTERTDVRGENRALYLLYLLNSVAQLTDEESGCFHVSVTAKNSSESMYRSQLRQRWRIECKAR